VPLANPAPGSVLARSLSRDLARVPWLPLALGVAVVAVVVWLRRRRLRRPATWAHQVAADLATGGARIGMPRRSDETLTDYTRRLVPAVPDQGRDLLVVAGLVERATYGGVEPSAAEIAAALTVTRHFRSVAKRRGRRRPDGRDGSGDLQGQPRAWASASSNEAPAASSGR
jgi:hypothetical protein